MTVPHLPVCIEQLELVIPWLRRKVELLREEKKFADDLAEGDRRMGINYDREFVNLLMTPAEVDDLIKGLGHMAVMLDAIVADNKARIASLADAECCASP
jgi:hypothetical protein